MADQSFRFGVVATPVAGPPQWLATAQRAEEQGYSTLLMPDGMQLLAPFPSLALAAGATRTLRVGTFVLASPLRPPHTAAWEGHSLAVLTDDRFDFGIGTGRPDVQSDVERLGLPFGTPGERLAQVAAAVEHLRELDGADRHTPVLVAAGGPKALAFAGREADIVTLAGPPLAGREKFVDMAAQVRAAAGDRVGDIEIAANIFVVGDEVQPWVQHFIQTDHASLVAHDSQMLLRGSVTEMADELQRRRDAYGLSYVSVNGAVSEQFAPVVERLSGK